MYRWERRDPAWPGHTAYVAIRAGEIVVGDRYRRDGFEHTHACHPRELLDGCFHDLIAEQFGTAVLDELVAEVRATQYLPARSPLPWPERAWLLPVAGAAELAAHAGGARGKARPAGRDAARAGREAPPAGPDTARAGREAPPAGADADRVSVALTGCRTVDLPLAAELRHITRAPIGPLLARIDPLPLVIATDIPRARGEALQRRLAELGATVELR